MQNRDWGSNIPIEATPVSLHGYTDPYRERMADKEELYRSLWNTVSEAQVLEHMTLPNINIIAAPIRHYGHRKKLHKPYQHHPL